MGAGLLPPQYQDVEGALYYMFFHVAASYSTLMSHFKYHPFEEDFSDHILLPS